MKSTYAIIALAMIPAVLIFLKLQSTGKRADGAAAADPPGRGAVRSDKERSLRSAAPRVVRRALGRNADGRVVFVGDVHGCADELQALLDEIAFAPGVDTLVMLGDLIGKGPKPAEVLRKCLELGAHTVLGNHDWQMLRWHAAQRTGGPEATVPFANPAGEHRGLARTLAPELVGYLQDAPHVLDVPQYNIIVVHAGLVPGVPIDEQNTFDAMHMRTLRDGEPSEGNAGEPWASLWPGPETLVFGHDAKRGLQRYPHAIGLDTGCVYGKNLTCYIMPEGRFHSVPARADPASPGSPASPL